MLSYEFEESILGGRSKVLILVLMEYALLLCHVRYLPKKNSLNPCSNGICSLTAYAELFNLESLES